MIQKYEPRRGDHLLVIGFGPVAVRLVDELLPAVASGDLRLTVVGAESRVGYNRVLVGEYGVGRLDEDGLALLDLEDWTSRGVEVLTGTEVTWLDRSARQAHVVDTVTRTPATLDYDLVVLAVGARPNLPVLRGINPDPGAAALLPPGVTVLRTPEDAADLREAVARRGRVVVLGGGVLGVEVALAAHEEGCPVTVVHHRPWLLTRSTDAIAGAMLNGVLARHGVEVVTDAVAKEVLRDATGAFRALRLADGRTVEGDVLVLSCGVTPRTRIAEGAGLRVARGIVVDHELEADPEARVFALGDCAEVLCDDPSCPVCPARVGRGPMGLVGPGWRQAEWLARRLLAALRNDPGPLEPLVEEDVDSIRLKARRLDFGAGGLLAGEPWQPQPAGQGVALWVDGARGKLVKSVVRDGVVVGWISLGMPRAGAELALLHASGRPAPVDLSVLLRLDGADGGEEELTPASTVCRCAGVAAGTISEAISGGCSTVEEVRTTTRAGSGCGGCRGSVEKLLRELVPQAG
ncbi:FAD-dependent oxidoreductase [Raineyella fluvialis]|uniref:NAD(P)/FAD-dependent oxidoreductase n=1 Tax=Raineyella fluvialis TaxID=2662261 RepID=A0A5Q2F9R6_9ACTN|nr:FAD-dependent oxidoreductase [Raineyella fluvialis]QGF23121.1 NAD(P)/FAD-dependent oxidoreductase [Raineyella fluvialis]